MMEGPRPRLQPQLQCYSYPCLSSERHSGSMRRGFTVECDGVTDKSYGIQIKLSSIQNKHIFNKSVE